MNIFDKRPLSIILCITLGGFVFFALGNDLVRNILFLCGIALVAAFVVLTILKKPKLLLLISGICLLVSMLCSHLYFDLWFAAEKRFDSEVTVVGHVTDIDYSEYSAICTVKSHSINSEPISAYTLIFYLEREKADPLSIGASVKFKCALNGFDEDSRTYRYSDGISAVCEGVTDIEVTGEERFVLSAALDKMREGLTRYAIMLSDDECGSMVSALLIGERDALSNKVQLDFKRLGITHLLALSGMHLAIISMALDFILSKFKIKKGIRVGTVAVFTAAYMLFTGLPPSVCRAGLMLLISSLLYFLSRDNDSITSLFTSVAIIVALAPYSIFDLSLWLSAFATLGVIIFSEWKQSRQKEKKKSKNLIGKVADVLAFSAFAIIPTLFISYFIFDGISILSPIATPIFSIPVEIIMYLGTLMLIVGAIIPLGFILSPVVHFTTELAGKISALDVYVTNKPWLADALVVILSVAFFAFITLKIKGKKRAVSSILLALTSLFVVLGVVSSLNSHKEVVAYHAENRQDEFIIISDDRAFLVSSSQHSRASAYESIDALSSLGITKLDKIYFANLSRGLDENLSVLLSNILVREVIIPAPRNDDERAIADKLFPLVKAYETILSESADVNIKIGAYEIIPIYSVPYGDDTAQNSFFIHGNGDSILYLSSGMLDKSTRELTLENIKHSSAVVFGGHGKKHKSKIYFTAENEIIEKLIFSGENLYLDQNTALFYDKNGCEIISHPYLIIISD